MTADRRRGYIELDSDFPANLFRIKNLLDALLLPLEDLLPALEVRNYKFTTFGKFLEEAGKGQDAAKIPTLFVLLSDLMTPDSSIAAVCRLAPGCIDYIILEGRALRQSTKPRHILGYGPVGRSSAINFFGSLALSEQTQREPLTLLGMLSDGTISLKYTRYMGIPNTKLSVNREWMFLPL